MALIGKIRKNMWLVFIIIGIALAGFVVMDMVSASNQGGGGGATAIGEVNGQTIDYRDFNAVENALYSGTGDTYGSKKATWDYMVERALITNEADKNGFNVPTEELKNLLFGASPAPIVRQMYSDPATGQFNRQALLEVKQAIEGGQVLNPTFENRWAQIEKQVRASQLQQKIGAAVAKGLYTPTWMVEQQESVNNTNVDFAVVRVPFDVIEDEIIITDDDVNSFISGNKDRYNTDKESRMIKYAVMDVIPTVSDSTIRKEEIAELIPEFRITDNDSLYASNNEGFYSPYYNKTEDLPESIREVVPTMEIGEVYGPYIDNNNYFAVKLTDKRMVPDSVQARHILRSTVAAQGGSSVADALTFVDSLRTVLSRRGQTFDSLAIKHSQDPGSSFNGGDLGTFTQGRMIGPFNNAVFLGGKKGGIYTVTTSVGVHLIEIQDIVYNDREDDYQVAFVRNPITPTDATQERLEGEMIEIITANRDMASLSAAIEGRNDISLVSAGPFNKNDYAINGLGLEQTSRDIIKWAFDQNTKVGSVSSELYVYSDNVNYFDSKYVIATLDEIIKPGMPTTAALKSRLEAEILKGKRGKMLASQISSTDLNEIAAKYEMKVDTISNITFTSTFMPGMGNEPSVIAKAYSMNEGQVSSPIVGNNGVYIVKVVRKTPAAGNSNIPLVRNIMNTSARSQAAIKIMQALKEKAEINDGRSRFF